MAVLLTAALAIVVVAAVALLWPGRGSGPSQRNILFVLSDDQRPASYAAMPYLNSQQLITFPNTIAETGLCCPSRAEMLSGQFDSHTGVWNNQMANKLDMSETIGVWMQRRGYTTALIGKYLNSYNALKVPPGWNDWHVAMGDGLYTQYDYVMSDNGKKVKHGSTPDEYLGAVTTKDLKSFISKSSGTKKPWFAWFAPTMTHSPYTAAPDRKGTLSKEKITLDPAFGEADVKDKPAYVQAQPRSVAAKLEPTMRKQDEASRTLDDIMKDVDGTLRSSHVYDNTDVVFLTDNGLALGDHDWIAKRCEYNACMDTPLYVRIPGQGARTDDRMVSNVDVTSTIAGLAGATPAIPQDGHSLAPYLLKTETPDQRAAWPGARLVHWSGGDSDGADGKFDSFPQFWGVKTNTEKYVELDSGEKEYYDEVKDPWELHNLLAPGEAVPPDVAARVAALKVELDQLKQQADASRLPFHDAVAGGGPAQPLESDRN